ncbi:hypothetical protein V6N13_066628 [Hibiscus sabdariffa]|uniref:Uncharacterized protein n=1 Tax=Hibiscus sabdariffa TaxID=183260 RepID=A0ABR2DSM9_9ROSI
MAPPLNLSNKSIVLQLSSHASKPHCRTNDIREWCGHGRHQSFHATVYMIKGCSDNTPSNYCLCCAGFSLHRHHATSPSKMMSRDSRFEQLPHAPFRYVSFCFDFVCRYLSNAKEVELPRRALVAMVVT